MLSPAAVLILSHGAAGREDLSGKFLEKTGPRVLQDACALPDDWPQTQPGQALTDYFHCLISNCQDADPTVFDGSGLVHCSDVIASGMAPCGSSIPGIDFTVTDLCPEQCDQTCSGQMAAEAPMPTGAPSAAVEDWLQDEAEEAIDDQVSDDETQLGRWKLTLSMNTDQSNRKWFHLNGGKVVDLGVPFLSSDEPLLAVRLTEDENAADADKAVLVGEDMGCSNWKDIFAHPRIENSNVEDCRKACLGMDDCTDFSVNTEQGICETWKGTCVGWDDPGWNYYTFADKPFRPNFKSIAGSDEVTVGFWINWHDFRSGQTIVESFFQFTKIELVNGQLSATTRGGDIVTTTAESGVNVGPDAFHWLLFAFSKGQSTVTIYVDGVLGQTAHITWVDEPRGRDFGLPRFGALCGVVTGFQGFAGVSTQEEVTSMYQDMYNLYAASTYIEGGCMGTGSSAATAAPVAAVTAAPVATPAAPVVTAPPATAPPATVAPVATTAAPVVTAPPATAPPATAPPAPVVTAPPATAPPATAAPVATTAAPVVTAPPATAPPAPVVTAPPATAPPAPVVTAPPAPTTTPAPLEPAPTYSPGHVTSTAMCTPAVAGEVTWCVGSSDPDGEQSCDEICAAHGGCMEDCWFDAVPQFQSLAQKVGLTCSTTQMGGAPFDPSVEGTGTVNCGVSASTDPSDCGECEGHVVHQAVAGGRCGVRPYKQEPKIRRFCPCGAVGDTCGFTKTV